MQIIQFWAYGLRDAIGPIRGRIVLVCLLEIERLEARWVGAMTARAPPFRVSGTWALLAVSAGGVSFLAALAAKSRTSRPKRAIVTLGVRAGIPCPANGCRRLAGPSQHQPATSGRLPGWCEYHRRWRCWPAFCLWAVRGQ
jgi:hypothetical protein